MNNRSVSLKLLYYRYRDTRIFSLLTFCLIILVSFMLVWYVVMPQVQKYLSIREEVALLEEKISLLRSNVDTVRQSDAQVIETDLTTALAALPSDKDFEGILNAIASSALRSGITLDDFTFSVGKLATESAETNDLKSIPIVLGLSSTVDVATVFLDELNKKVPVSDVTILDVSDSNQINGSEVQVAFYYKPLSQTIIDFEKPIPKLSAEDREILQRVNDWKTQSGGIDQLSLIASATAALDN